MDYEECTRARAFQEGAGVQKTRKLCEEMQARWLGSSAPPGALMMNAAGEGPGYLMLQGESGVIPVPPHGVAGKTR